MEQRMMTVDEKEYLQKMHDRTHQLGVILMVIALGLIIAGLIFAFTQNFTATIVLGASSLFFIVPGGGSLLNCKRYSADIEEGMAGVLSDVQIKKKTIRTRNSVLHQLVAGKREYAIGKDYFEMVEEGQHVSMVVSPHSGELFEILLPGGAVIRIR